MVNIMMSRSYLDNPYLYLYFQRYIKKGMKVLIIPWSFRPDADYDTYRPGGERYQKLVNQFIPYDISERDIMWADYYLDSQETIVKKIKLANLIYLTGGLPDKLFERLEEFNIISNLETFDGVMLGVSAGAVVQFSTYHLSKDKDYKKFDIYPGLNIINDFGVEVHYGDHMRIQNKALIKANQIIPRTYYTIPDAGALIKDGNNIILINGAKKHYFKK
ncbi:MAG: Type 1 glutamine amidotransferase-like domain-containing protein [Acholeplasmataceae bacterium]